MTERMSETNHRLYVAANKAASKEWVAPGEEEGTVFDLRPDCLLCGGELAPLWDFETPRRCTNCGCLNIPWKELR